MVKDIPVLTGETLKFEEVMANYKKVLIQIARVYNEAMNIIHYMHDKYYYEKAQMAFVDTDPRINLAYGVAGLFNRHRFTVRHQICTCESPSQRHRTDGGIRYRRCFPLFR